MRPSAMSNSALSSTLRLRPEGSSLPKGSGPNGGDHNQRVCEFYEMGREELYARGRQKQRVAARRLAIYWAVRESGLTGISLARRNHLTQPSIVYAVQRGEKIAREGNYQLLN